MEWVSNFGILFKVMRKFKEYELIQEDEYLITIEYWYTISMTFTNP